MLEYLVMDRRSGEVFKEKTFGEKWIEWAYLTPLGRSVTGNLLLQKIISAFVGAYMKSTFSRSRIRPFIQEFNIVMSDFAGSEDSFESFNDFFIRQLRPGARNFPQKNEELGSPAEGRVSVYEIQSRDVPLYFKGQKLSVLQVLGANKSLAESFLGGWAIVIRLCPVDYHRFHFCDSGPTHKTQTVSGRLESVNPLSLYLNSKVFAENERQLTVQESENFGLLAYLEVGALCVGAIQQSFDPKGPIRRGQEKGYFEFGGSTQILFMQKHMQPSADLIQNSQKQLETLVRLGETIAIKKSTSGF